MAMLKLHVYMTQILMLQRFRIKTIFEGLKAKPQALWIGRIKLGALFVYWKRLKWTELLEWTTVVDFYMWL